MTPLTYSEDLKKNIKTSECKNALMTAMCKLKKKIRWYNYLPSEQRLVSEIFKLEIKKKRNKPVRKRNLYATHMNNQHISLTSARTKCQKFVETHWKRQ